MNVISKSILTASLYLFASGLTYAETKPKEATFGGANYYADGRAAFFIDANGKPSYVYKGPHRVTAITECNGGLVTAFYNSVSDKEWLYFSPDGLNLAGSGPSVPLYRGNHFTSWIKTNPNGPGLYVKLTNVGGDGKIYYSRNCTSLESAQ